MNKTSLTFAFLVAATLVACGKKHESAPSAVATPAPSPAVPAPAPAPAPSAQPTQAQSDLAEKQAKLDYATMEDGYLNDAHGQWAQSATASSVFGDDQGKTPSEGNLATNIAGNPDGRSWTNNHQDMGFDSFQAVFAKPTIATGVRIVCNETAVKSITKLELQDSTGRWVTVWSGISDIQPERRGPRNWFVKAVPKTAAPIQAVKATFANNVASGYKEVDAVQLIGE